MLARTCFVLIDPVRGFTDERGTYARVHGPIEMAPIWATVERVSTFISGLDRGVPTAWVRPIYRHGQFNPGGPMAEICLPGTSDVDFDPLLVPLPNAVLFDKHDMNAMSSPAFVNWMSSIKDSGCDSVCIGGFLLTSCVRHTALSVKKWAGSLEIEVPRALTASRQSKYVDIAGVSEVGAVLNELESAGIKVPDQSRLL